MGSNSSLLYDTKLAVDLSEPQFSLLYIGANRTRDFGKLNPGFLEHSKEAAGFGKMCVEIRMSGTTGSSNSPIVYLAFPGISCNVEAPANRRIPRVTSLSQDY